MSSANNVDKVKKKSSKKLSDEIPSEEKVTKEKLNNKFEFQKSIDKKEEINDSKKRKNDSECKQLESTGNDDLQKVF